jgi:outer membrane immunogenic protein
MKFVCVAAAAAVAFVSSAASANDISGFRLEALLGWDNVRIENLGNTSGFAYGAGIGYDFAVGETISVGVDAEIMGATTDAEATELVGGTPITARVSTGRDIFLGARMTGKVADRFAVYARGGYVNGRAEATVSGAGFSDVASGNLDGFRLGAGGQFLLGEKAYVGGEYRYSNYESDVVRHQVLATFGYRF